MGRWDAQRRERGRGREGGVRGGGGRAGGLGGEGGGDSRQRRFFWTTPEAPTEHPSCGRRVRATTKKCLKPAVNKNPATNQGLGPSKAAWKSLGPTTGVWPPADLFSRAAPRAPPSRGGWCVCVGGGGLDPARQTESTGPTKGGQNGKKAFLSQSWRPRGEGELPAKPTITKNMAVAVCFCRLRASMKSSAFAPVRSSTLQPVPPPLPPPPRRPFALWFLSQQRAAPPRCSAVAAPAGHCTRS
jgi:hypothetical protein